jgi:tripartite-type tricarboxylate transporter receptor subunit TctC
LAAPAKTPRAIVSLLAKETGKALREPDVQGRFADLGAVLVGNSPEQFGAYVRSETKKWHAVVKAADIKLQ